MIKHVFLIALAGFLFFSPLKGQQISDSDFDPKIAVPRYKPGKGPLLLLDEGHHNFHPLNGRYTTFAKVLKADGYRVDAHKGPFSEKSLEHVDILVIANALNAQNETNWSKPVYSAFTSQEIQILKHWVERGGSLFLIADHMPFPGAASDLASVFGFQFFDGFARDSLKVANGAADPDLFSVREGTLSKHVAIQGKEESTAVDSIATFGGQAFRIPAGAVSLITLPKRFHLLLPDTAWKFNPSTPQINAENFSQGALLNAGKGKVVVFGEAAMFSAQLSGQAKKPMGMNHPAATGNVYVLRNILRWLTEEAEDND